MHKYNARINQEWQVWKNVLYGYITNFKVAVNKESLAKKIGLLDPFMEKQFIKAEPNGITDYI